MYLQGTGQSHTVAIHTDIHTMDPPRLGLIREAEPLAARHFYLMSTRGFFFAACADCLVVLVAHSVQPETPAIIQGALPLVTVSAYGLMLRAQKRGWRSVTTVSAAAGASSTLAFAIQAYAPNAAARAAAETLITAAWLHGWTVLNARRSRDPPLLIITVALPLITVLAAGLLGLAYPGSLAGHLVSTLGPLLATVLYTILMSRAWDKQYGILGIGPTAVEAFWLTLVPCQQ